MQPSCNLLSCDLPIMRFTNSLISSVLSIFTRYLAMSYKIIVVSFIPLRQQNFACHGEAREWGYIVLKTLSSSYLPCNKCIWRAGRFQCLLELCYYINYNEHVHDVNKYGHTKLIVHCNIASVDMSSIMTWPTMFWVLVVFQLLRQNPPFQSGASGQADSHPGMMSSFFSKPLKSSWPFATCYIFCSAINWLHLSFIL